MQAPQDELVKELVQQYVTELERIIQSKQSWAQYLSEKLASTLPSLAASVGLEQGPKMKAETIEDVKRICQNSIDFLPKDGSGDRALKELEYLRDKITLDDEILKLHQEVISSTQEDIVQNLGPLNAREHNIKIKLEELSKKREDLYSQGQEKADSIQITNLTFEQKQLEEIKNQIYTSSLEMELKKTQQLIEELRAANERGDQTEALAQKLKEQFELLQTQKAEFERNVAPDSRGPILPDVAPDSRGPILPDVDALLSQASTLTDKKEDSPEQILPQSSGISVDAQGEPFAQQGEGFIQLMLESGAFAHSIGSDSRPIACTAGQDPARFTYEQIKHLGVPYIEIKPTEQTRLVTSTYDQKNQTFQTKVNFDGKNSTITIVRGKQNAPEDQIAIQLENKDGIIFPSIKKGDKTINFEDDPDEFMKLYQEYCPGEHIIFPTFENKQIVVQDNKMYEIERREGETPEEAIKRAKALPPLTGERKQNVKDKMHEKRTGRELISREEIKQVSTEGLDRFTKTKAMVERANSDSKAISESLNDVKDRIKTLDDEIAKLAALLEKPAKEEERDKIETRKKELEAQRDALNIVLEDYIRPNFEKSKQAAERMEEDIESYTHRKEIAEAQSNLDLLQKVKTQSTLSAEDAKQINQLISKYNEGKEESSKLQAVSSESPHEENMQQIKELEKSIAKQKKEAENKAVKPRHIFTRGKMLYAVTKGADRIAYAKKEYDDFTKDVSHLKEDAEKLVTDLQSKHDSLMKAFDQSDPLVTKAQDALERAQELKAQLDKADTSKETGEQKEIDKMNQLDQFRLAAKQLEGDSIEINISLHMKAQEKATQNIEALEELSKGSGAYKDSIAQKLQEAKQNLEDVQKAIPDSKLKPTEDLIKQCKLEEEIKALQEKRSKFEKNIEKLNPLDAPDASAKPTALEAAKTLRRTVTQVLPSDGTGSPGVTADTPTKAKLSRGISM